MLYLILLVLAVAARLIPHIANVTPIGGLALFVGATALSQPDKRLRTAGLIIPFLALIVSDFVIGFYSWPVMLSVYLSFAVTLSLGLFVHRHYNWQMIVGASLVGSLFFFLATNAAVWAFTPMYVKTLHGLGESYTMAMPFFRNSLFSDLLYTAVLFGSYEWAIRPHKQPAIAIS